MNKYILFIIIIIYLVNDFALEALQFLLQKSQFSVSPFQIWFGVEVFDVSVQKWVASMITEVICVWVYSMIAYIK